MAVHVFGIPCDVLQIEAIAKRHNLKVIYDGAHAFGVQYLGRSLLSYGDISTCSFHSTKLFHTVEGGCIVARDTNISSNIELLKRFGHEGDTHFQLGINGKASELHAAMGLCNLKYIKNIIRLREKIVKQYDRLLIKHIQRPLIPVGVTYNYGHYPVVFKDEKETLAVIKVLNGRNIFPRRYFYPSLNTLSYLPDRQPCPVSEDIASRIVCLPLYPGLSDQNVRIICKLIINELT